MRGVTLHTWRSPIGFEDGLDEMEPAVLSPVALAQPACALGGSALESACRAIRRMHSKLGRNSFDASDSELVFPANLLEQLTFGSPLHPGLLPHQQDAPVKGVSQFTASKWAVSEYRNQMPLLARLLLVQMPD
jgi:hypothetical protein